jgi:SAM-dependent methyltransferase
MNHPQFDFLLSPRGQNLLAQLAQENLSDSNHLKLLTRLRKEYSAEEAASALTMARLRLKAVDKFGEDASKLYFTEDALQQASDPQIRAYRSHALSGLRILDVCCGIGADSLSFAKAGASVYGLDIDPLRIAMAQANAAALGLDAHFSVADVTQGIPSGFDMIFFDPARRDEQGRRLYDVEAYIPPLSIIQTWKAPKIMVKLSPAVDLEQFGNYDGLFEFISVDGDLKETVLHVGDETFFKATLISNGKIHHWGGVQSLRATEKGVQSLRATEKGVQSLRAAEKGVQSLRAAERAEVDFTIAEPHGWLCEPDASLMRAGLIREVAATFNSTMLDETIAYFCAAEKPNSPWLRAWKIREWLPFNLKRLRERLRFYDVGTLTVKKRGSPISPEELIRQVKPKGKESATVALSRYAGQHIAIICDDIAISH